MAAVVEVDIHFVVAEMYFVVVVVVAAVELGLELELQPAAFVLEVVLSVVGQR